jgi:hypothetical protein
MALDKPVSNKMIQTPPAKKEYHFAATAEHCAEVVYADTIQEAEAIYHRVKRLINPVVGGSVEQSTPAADEEKNDIQ